MARPARLIGINHVALEVGDLDEAIETGAGSGFDFHDPWGNRLEVVEYAAIQFERTSGVKGKLGIEALGKSEAARREIEEHGLA